MWTLLGCGLLLAIALVTVAAIHATRLRETLAQRRAERQAWRRAQENAARRPMLMPYGVRGPYR